MNVKRILLLLSVVDCRLMSAVGQATTADGCFFVFRNQRLKCAIPFERRTVQTEVDCEALCLQMQPQCQSFQYSPYDQLCDLFLIGHRPDGSGYGSSRESGHDSFDHNPNDDEKSEGYEDNHQDSTEHGGFGSEQDDSEEKDADYVHRQTIEFNMLRSHVTSAVPLLQSEHDGYKRYGFGAGEVDTGEGFGSRGDEGDDDGYGKSHNGPPESGEAHSNDDHGRDSGDEHSEDGYGSEEKPYDAKGNQCYHPLVVRNHDAVSYFVSTSNCAVTTPTVTPNAVALASAPLAAYACEEGKTTRFFEVEGIELAGSDDFVFSTNNTDICGEACATNLAPDGTALNFTCRSADFNQFLTQCAVSSQLLPPVGVGQFVENPNNIYLEPFCINSTLVTNCGLNDRFVKQPQRILVGVAETSVNATTLEECLSNCLNSQTLFGFRCLSGLIFYDVVGANCVLNTQTRSTQPSLFAIETREVVDYFEPAHCANQQGTFLLLNAFDAKQDVERPQGKRSYCGAHVKTHRRFHLCRTVHPAGFIRGQQKDNALSRRRLNSFSRGKRNWPPEEK